MRPATPYTLPDSFAAPSVDTVKLPKMSGINQASDVAAPTTDCDCCGNAGPSCDASPSKVFSKAPSSTPNAQGHPPLSFSRWTALQSYSTDFLLLLLDLIGISTPYVAQQWANRLCSPLGGAPHAALQTLPLDTAKYRVDRLASQFPCDASYTAQLVYTVVTGAAIDPWVRIRAGDWGNLLYVCLLVLTLVLAIACPRLYVRCRWPLFAVNTVAYLVGHAVAAVTVPLPMLALIGPSFYGSFRRRGAVLHSAWRCLVILQVPLAQQLALALPLWLFTAFLALNADRRLPPTTAAAATNSAITLLHSPSVLLSTFLGVAVLPCVVAYLRDNYLLRPRYAAYVRRHQQQQQAAQEQQQRQRQQQLTVRRSPRTGGKGQDAAAPAGSSHHALDRAERVHSPRSPTASSPTASSPRRRFAPSPSNSPTASPRGSPSGRVAVAGRQSEEGTRHQAPGQQASTPAAPEAAYATPAASAPALPSTTNSAIAPRQQLANANGGGCGGGGTASAAASGPTCKDGHTAAPIQRRPTFDITQLLALPTPQAAAFSPQSPLPQSTGPTPSPSSAQTEARSPSAAVAATAAIAAAAGPSIHLTPVATADRIQHGTCAPTTPAIPPPHRPRQAHSPAAASTRSSSSLYRQACPLGQVHTLSVKMPLRHNAAHSGAPSDTMRAAASVSAAAAAAVRRYNAAAAAAATTAAAPAGYGMDLGGGGGAPCIAASAGHASPPQRMVQPVGCLRVLSSVVVAGCVHLLMVVRAMPVAVGEREQQQQGPAAHTGAAAVAAAAATEANSFASDGGQPSADCSALDEDGVSYAVHGAAVHRHVTVEMARRCVELCGGGCDGEGDGGTGLAGAEDGEYDDEEAWGLVVQREVEVALRGIQMETERGLGGSAVGCSSGGEGEHSSGGSGAGFVWPPAVPVADPAALDSPAFLGTGGQGGAACSGRGVEVALVVPRGMLRGCRTVRCVVAGGPGADKATWATRPGGVGAAGDCTAWLSSVPGVSAWYEEQEDEAGQEAEHGGWEEGDGEEGVGCGLVQDQLHADVELHVELPRGQGQEQEQEGSGRAGEHSSTADGGWGDADGYMSVRLSLPASAVCAPGLLSIRLLPPRHSSTSSPASPSPVLHPDAPLVTLPLLVLPPAAAAEMYGLYDSVVRRAAAGAADAEGSNITTSSSSSHDERTEAPFLCNFVADAISGISLTTEAQVLPTVPVTAVAAAAVSGSGLDGLLYDMGTLLQLPAASSAPAPDPWVWRGLLSHLATWRMGACLQACLGALQRAGVVLRMDGRELGVDLPGEEQEGGEDGGGERGDAGRRRQGLAAAVAALLGGGAAGGGAAGEAGEGVWVGTHDVTASSGGACASPSLAHTQHAHLPLEGRGPQGPQGAAKFSDTPLSCQPGPDAANAQPATAAETHQHLHQQPPDTAQAQGSSSSLPPATSTSISQGTTQLPLLPSATRSLLFGFTPALEHRYQQYKAACCFARDHVGLVLRVGTRLSSMVRTVRLYGAVAAAAGEAAAAAQCGGQVASEMLFLTVGVMVAVTALLTPALSRHRTRLLLLKGLADCLVLLAIAWPPPSEDAHTADSGWLPMPPSWLPHPVRHLWTVLLLVLVQRRLHFPHTWHRVSRRYGLHLLHFGVWEPTILQLSPRHQALLAVCQALPMTLFARQVQRDISGSDNGGSADGASYGGSWLSAAAFGVGNSLLTLALSCATDLHCRRSFLRQEREQERARQQQGHGGEQRARGRGARGGGAEGRRDDGCGLGGCKWEEEE